MKPPVKPFFRPLRALTFMSARSSFSDTSAPTKGWPVPMRQARCRPTPPPPARPTRLLLARSQNLTGYAGLTELLGGSEEKDRRGRVRHELLGRVQDHRPRLPYPDVVEGPGDAAERRQVRSTADVKEGGQCQKRFSPFGSDGCGQRCHGQYCGSAARSTNGGSPSARNWICQMSSSSSCSSTCSIARRA